MNTVLYQRSNSVCLLMLCLIFGTSVHEVNGQTLISKLPDDGTWAKYDVSTRITMPEFADRAPVRRSQVVLRSVGTEKIDGQICRWIEMETLTSNKALRAGRSDAMKVYKILVPENLVNEGKSPAGKIKKAKVLTIEGDVRSLGEVAADSKEIKEMLRNMWPEGKVEKEVPAESIECGLGKLECQVTQFVYKSTQPDQAAAVDKVEKKYFIEIKQTIYRHEKSPFGAVKTIGEIVQVAGRKRMPMSKTETILKETGTGAKSAIPEKK